MVWQYALAIGVGYLAGSIPFGWIAGKATRGIDVRDFGSIAGTMATPTSIPGVATLCGGKLR